VQKTQNNVVVLCLTVYITEYRVEILLGVVVIPIPKHRYYVLFVCLLCSVAIWLKS